MNGTSRILSFKLESAETDDGRILLSSPDLEGFHFLMSTDEDPKEALIPTIIEFMSLYLKAKVKNLTPAQSPRQYKKSLLNLGPDRRIDLSYVAEVAA